MTLHLILQNKWYDMITKGDKREEYRQIKPYWTTRLFVHKYQFVCFHRAYTNITTTYQIESISVGYGKKDLGASDNMVYIIVFKEIGR